MRFSYVWGSAEAADGAQQVTKLLFGDQALLTSKNAADLSILKYAPRTAVARRAALAMSATSLATWSGLTASKGEAARLIQQKSLYVNGKAVASSGANIGDDDMLHAEWIILRSGKKHFRVLQVDSDY